MAAVLASSRAPTFPGAPLLGHLPGINKDILGLLTTANRACGPIARLRLGYKTAHAVFTPELVEQVLIEQRDKFVKYSTITTKVGLPILLGQGLLMSTGELWTKQRKLMSPFFHKQYVSRLADTITASGTRTIERWNRAGDGVVDFQDEMMQTTLEVICGSMFTMSDTASMRKISESIDTGLHMAFATVKNPLHPPLSWPTPGNRNFQRAMSTLHDEVDGLIEVREKARAAGRDTDREKTDLLSALLDARYDDGSAMSREQVRDEVITIIGTGHETTSMAMTWGASILSRRPEVKKRLVAEIDAVLGMRTPVLADLANMPYLGNAFSEILRLYPTAPVIPRAVLTDAVLNDYDIPAGSMVYTSIYHVHRDPRWWEAPLEFHPERFEKGKPGHKCAYLPFGAGPRFCIGASFAELEAQLLLAQIYQHYDVEAVSQDEPFGVVAVSMRPRDGLPVRLKRRA